MKEVLAIVALCGGCAIAAPFALQPATRAVAVSVNVKDSAGTAIPGVPLRRALNLHRLWDKSSTFGLTDASGNAAMTMTLAPTEDSVSVSLSSRTAPAQRTAAQVAEEAARLRAIMGQYAFLQSYRDKVTLAATTASLNIAARPSVKSSFCLTINGQPAKGEIDAAGIVGFATEMQPITITRKDRFTLHGVPKGVACEASVQYDGQFAFFAVPAQTADAELPAIDINRAAAVVPVQATLQRPANMPRPDGTKGGPIGITLLRSDGGGGYVMGRADHLGSPDPSDANKFVGLNATGTGSTLTIAPGEYWVLPGYWADLDGQVAFRQMLKAGRDVSASGLPRVTATAGQPVTLSLDGDAMVSNYEQFTKALIEGAMPILGPDLPNYVPAVP